MGNLKLSGHNFVGGITPDSLRRSREARKAELSRTWKERHAKGVPAEMNFDQWSDYVDTLPIDFKPKNGFYYGLMGLKDAISGPEIPYISIKNKEIGTYARFCNFRYKPEWIEKRDKNERKMYYLKTGRAL